MSAPTVPSLTQRDFDTNFAFLVDHIRRTAPELWNSFHEGDLGTVLLDTIAFDHTQLSLIADNMFKECFLDTLRQYESLRHFCRLTGYQIRRNSAASIEVLATSSVTPSAPSYLLLRRGTKVTSKDGLPWEVTEDYRILPGYLTPVRRITGYGDIKARTEISGIEVESDALVTIKQGESFAVLTDSAGQRLPSNYNFTQLCGPGQILKLTSQKIGNVFGPAPDSTRREFVVTGTGKLEFDLHGNSVLYLDRPWDLSDYSGKWELESRSIILVQGETREDRTVGPSTESAARNHTVTSVFYPVLSGEAESYVVSGLLTSAENRSGLTVSVNGVVWTETASLLFEGPNDLVYEVDFDHLDRALVKFGNGVNGAILPVNAEITMQYRTGGGAAGNLTQGSFDTTISGALIPSTGNSPTVFLSNPYTVGSGGRDRETIVEARKNISAFIRTNDRAVTVQDYTYLASNFTDPAAGRIAQAIGILHQNAVPREQNIVWVYAWADRGTGQLSAPSLPLKQALHAYLNLRKMVTDEVVVVDGVSIRVPLLFQYRYSRSRERWEIEEEIRSAVSAVFARQVPGQPLLLSDLYEAMGAIDGLDMTLLGSPTTNFTPEKPYELLVNSTLEPRSSRLSVAASRGAVSVVVADPSAFYPGGIMMLWEPGRTPTVAEVDNVSGSVVTLKRHTPLRDDYSTADAAGRGAVLYNSDYVGIGWQYEHKVNVHVRYGTGFADVEALDAAIAYKIRFWFENTLRPEQPLQKSALEHLVSTTSGVTSYQIDLGAFDGSAEVVEASIRERLVLGHLSINGVTY